MLRTGIPKKALTGHEFRDEKLLALLKSKLFNRKMNQGFMWLKGIEIHDNENNIGQIWREFTVTEKIAIIGGVKTKIVVLLQGGVGRP